MESTGRRKPSTQRARTRPRVPLRARFVRVMLTTGLSVTMIATGGFGTMPNPLSQTVSQVVSNALPAQIAAPINNVLEQAGSSPLPTPDASYYNNGSSAPDLFDQVVSIIQTGNIQPTSESSVTTESASVTPIASETITNTPTGSVTPTPTSTHTPTLTPTFTSTPTVTSTTTKTATVTPTKTFLPTWTPSPPPAPTLPPTLAVSPTPVVTLIPANHINSSFSLNGGGSTISVPGGTAVTWDYTFQVWGDSSTCPGCDYQLVLGLENSWKVCYDKIYPGDYPAGIKNVTDTLIDNAPSTPGTYTIYSFYGQYLDCSSAIAAYSSAVGTAQGTITVP